MDGLNCSYSRCEDINEVGEILYVTVKKIKATKTNTKYCLGIEYAREMTINSLQKLEKNL